MYPQEASALRDICVWGVVQVFERRCCGWVRWCGGWRVFMWDGADRAPGLRSSPPGAAGRPAGRAGRPGRGGPPSPRRPAPAVSARRAGCPQTPPSAAASSRPAAAAPAQPPPPQRHRWGPAAAAARRGRGRCRCCSCCCPRRAPPPPWPCPVSAARRSPSAPDSGSPGAPGTTGFPLGAPGHRCRGAAPGAGGREGEAVPEVRLLAGRAGSLPRAGGRSLRGAAGAAGDSEVPVCRRSRPGAGLTPGGRAPG